MMNIVVVLIVGACSVGLAARVPYVIGGEEARIGEFPYIGSLRNNGQHVCGATLINEYWAVTAAHCIHESAYSVEVYFGIHDKYDMRYGNPVVTKVSQSIMHPFYQVGSGMIPNDIALLRLRSPVRYNQNVQPARLPNQGQVFSGQYAIASGWGDNDKGSTKQLKARLNVYDHSQCSRMLGVYPYNMDVHLCAGIIGQSGLCKGDSGGPLVYQSGSSNILIGVTSFVMGDCSLNFPTGFVNVANYRNWIKDNTGV